MKSIKNRKYKGSVLLTVVAVMALLIVFLFGTLVLATSANNRAHVNYSTAQTNVTSRLVCESAITAIDLDADYKKAVGGIKSGDAPLSVPVQISSDDTTINTATLGKVDDVLVSYAGKRKFYDTTKNEWLDRDLIRFTSKVTLGGVTSTTNAYVLKHMSDDDDSSPSGAGFVTTGGADFACQTSLYGGTYVNIPSLDTVKNFDYDNPSTYRALSYYAGGPSMLLNNSGSVIEADAVINTNLAIENWNGFIFPGPGKGVTIWGDMIFNGANAADHLRYVNNAKLTETYNFNEIPYVYVDGGVYGKSWSGDMNEKSEAKIVIGNSDNGNSTAAAVAPLNVFAGYIYARSAAVCNIYGNLYLMDEDKTSVLEGGGTHLYGWTSSVVNKTKSTTAAANITSICSNGSLELKNCTIDGDVRVKHNCTIGEGVTINGNLVVGGNLSIANTATFNLAGGKKIYCDNVSASTDTSALYDRVENIMHPAETKTLDECVKVDNTESRNYYVYSHEAHGHKDLNGNDLWNDLYFKYTAEYDGTVDLDGLSADELQKYITGGAFQWDLPQNPVTNSKDDYLVKTKIDLDSVVKEADGTYTFSTYVSYEPADSDYTYYDLDSGDEVDVEDATVEIPAYRAKVDYEGNEITPTVKTEKKYTYYRKDDHTEVDEYTATHGTGGSITGVTTDTIANFVTNYKEQPYPRYAERKTVLGIELVPDPSDGTKNLKKSETQVVKTMKDVLDNVINPYDNSDIPNALKSAYNSLSAAGKVLHSPHDVATEMGVTLTSAKPGADGKLEIVTQNNTTGKFYINKSCILDLSVASGDAADGAIVIDPDGNDILIVIKKFDIAAGINLFFDDTKGGKVYFYIDGKGEMKFEGQGVQSTVSWYDFLKSATPFQVTSDQVYTMYAADGTTAEPKTIMQQLGTHAVPNVFFYGAKGSKLTWANFQYCTANIVSPNITLKIDATSGAITDGTDIYYNGHNVRESVETGGKSNYKYIFGCCNSKTADFPNQINELWITDGGGKTPPTPPTPDEFWYKVLYYDEY
ncbi:MAG: hypothetical protein Q4A05_07310 [Ruminococcus sp.]|nr:hypothetical protein [Ruminococcus sp.]